MPVMSMTSARRPATVGERVTHSRAALERLGATHGAPQTCGKRHQGTLPPRSPRPRCDSPG
eukprot:2819185-Heterocapsa_arctica.AAC.1